VFFLATLMIALDGIPTERTPAATGLFNFARITAGSFAASLVTTIWDRRESLHQSRLAESATAFGSPYGQALRDLGSAGLAPQQPAGLVAQQMVDQAYLLSSTDIFWACGWISLALIVLVWIARRPTSQGAAVAAAD